MIMLTLEVASASLLIYFCLHARVATCWIFQLTYTLDVLNPRAVNHNDNYNNGEINLALLEKEYGYSSLVCSGSKDITKAETKMACVPDTGSMADNSVLLDSYKSSKLTCQDNPCPVGKWPWLSEDGYQRCLDADTEEIQNCPYEHFVVEEDGGILKCQTIVPFFTANSETCRRGQIFRRGKCQARFFG